jgi:hypothetical protein
MTNEAVPIALSSPLNCVRRKVADGQAIEKYTLLQLIDPNSVAPGSGAANACPFGGIAAAEKVASDGSTDIAVYMDGVFDLSACGLAITPGCAVVISGANQITLASEAGIAAGCLVGWAEETAAVTVETIRVRLRGGQL